MKTQKSLSFLLGTLALALVFGLVLAGCAKKFDGSSLIGSTWVGTISEDYSDYDAGKYTASITVKFTSDTEGTQTVKISKWEGTWPAEMKTKVLGQIAELNGDFTYSYDPFEHYGEAQSPGEDFEIDVSAQTLTTDIIDDVVLKLQKAPKVSLKLTGPLTAAEAESLNQEAAIEKGWTFEEGEGYGDLVVKQGQITAAKFISRYGRVYLSLEVDDQGNATYLRDGERVSF